jgi:fumarylpyruvate hydrolase
LVVAIGKTGAHIDVKDAPDFVWGYAVGLDMTRRDLQAESKAQGRPWSTAKGFDFSAPISPITPIAQCGWLSSAAISLDVNGVRKQDSNIDQLIWNVAEVIATLSTFFTLKEGDLIFTGTPAGVGAVVKGDVMRGEIAGLGNLNVRVG